MNHLLTGACNNVQKPIHEGMTLSSMEDMNRGVYLNDNMLLIVTVTYLCMYF